MCSTNARVNGGYLPASRRGARESSLVAGWDFYATYCALANLSSECAHDPDAQAAGLPQTDSVNVWPLIAGTNATPARTMIAIGDTSALSPNGDGNTLVGGVIVARQGERSWGLYKLLVGAKNKLYKIDQDTMTGPFWPNSSSHLVPQAHSRLCSRTAKQGCLFDLITE